MRTHPLRARSAKLVFLVALAWALLNGSACQCGARLGADSRAAAPLAGTEQVLATIANDELPTSTDMALPERPAFQIHFHPRGLAVAYLANVAGENRVVFRGTRGPALTGIDGVKLSDNGLRLAYAAQVDAQWAMVVDGQVEQFGESVGEPVFSADGRHLAYVIRRGEGRHLVIDGVASPHARIADALPIFGPSSDRVFYLAEREAGQGHELRVTDLGHGSKPLVDNVISMQANERSDVVAAVCQVESQQRVVHLDLRDLKLLDASPLYDKVEALAFAAGGGHAAWIGARGGSLFAGAPGREEALPPGTLNVPIAVAQGLPAIAVSLTRDGATQVHVAFSQSFPTGGAHTLVTGLTFSGDTAHLAYAAQDDGHWRLVVDGHSGPPFDMVVAPVVTHDGQRVAYRARRAGQRFVVLADGKGGTLQTFAPFEAVFPVRIEAGERSLSYGAQSGKQLLWRIESL